MFPVLRIREVVTHTCQKRLCKLKWQSSVMTLIGYHWHYMPGKTLKSRDCLGPWFLSVNKININCKLRMFWAYCPSLEMIAVRDWIVFLSNFIMVLSLTRFSAQSQKMVPQGNSTPHRPWQSHARDLRFENSFIPVNYLHLPLSFELCRAQINGSNVDIVRKLNKRSQAQLNRFFISS